jgi:hypothetical protein
VLRASNGEDHASVQGRTSRPAQGYQRDCGAQQTLLDDFHSSEIQSSLGKQRSCGLDPEHAPTQGGMVLNIWHDACTRAAFK